MSFQNKARDLQTEKGKSFHPGDEDRSKPFAELIAVAMRLEWGATPSARKEVCRLTGANERAVRNWFEAKNGPSGENLVHLLRHSHAVLTTVLSLAGRQDLLVSANVMGLRQHLSQLIETIDASRKPS
jgi:hypothetical protein